MNDLTKNRERPRTTIYGFLLHDLYRLLTNPYINLNLFILFTVVAVWSRQVVLLFDN